MLCCLGIILDSNGNNRDFMYGGLFSMIIKEILGMFSPIRRLPFTKRIIPDILHILYTHGFDRNKKLHRFIVKAFKFYADHSDYWKFNRKNYLGRRYITHSYRMGCTWYMIEQFGVKWGK